MGGLFMKRAVLLSIAVFCAGSSYTDPVINASLWVGYGIGGNGSNGCIVDPIEGTAMVLQVIDGGGDGLDYSVPNTISFYPV